MTKVIVAGAAGRMGRRIAFMVDQHPALQLVGGFEQPGNPEIGKDIGELAGFGNAGGKKTYWSGAKYQDCLCRDIFCHDCIDSIPERFLNSRPFIGNVWIIFPKNMFG